MDLKMGQGSVWNECILGSSKERQTTSYDMSIQRAVAGASRKDNRQGKEGKKDPPKSMILILHCM